MLSPCISLRCMMLASMLALQLLCAAQDPGSTVGDWGSGETANYKKMAISTELEARAGIKAKSKLGQSDKRTEATAAKLQLHEKLDFEMVGKTVFQLKEDIASLKEKNAVRRAQREKMRAAAKIMEAKLAKETGIDKTTLDNAMAAAMNDVTAENANASAPMSEKQMEDQLMKAALTELNQAGSGVTVGWVHSILMMLALMIVAGVVYVLYAKSEYVLGLLDSVGLGDSVRLGLPRSVFDSSNSRLVFSKLRAKYTASHV